MILLAVIIISNGCVKKKLILNNVNISGRYADGEWKLDIEFASEDDSLRLEYWPENRMDDKKSIDIKVNGYKKINVSDLKSNSNYILSFVSLLTERRSQNYFYKTPSLNEFFNFNVTKLSFKDPKSFSNTLNGGILVSQRETPGVVQIIGKEGNLVWEHKFEDLGVRVAHFTQQNTIICILGNNKDSTSYGREIIEINSKGDTLLHFIKGVGDFMDAPHHEVFKDQKGNIVYLYLDKRILDLRSIGGTKNDTIKGDGIQVLDTNGKQIWKWSVFDILDPLKEKDILKNKADWLHANSLSCDFDGNYLISFLHSGEVWKISKNTGDIIWKFGKNGTIKCDKNFIFSQSHAFHSIGKNKYLCFDNQLDTKKPKIHGYEIDESKLSARSIINFSLPADYFTDRMGSTYLINDGLFLTCASKKGKVILSDKNGNLLWGIQIDFMKPYRAEYIPYESIQAFLQ